MIMFSSPSQVAERTCLKCGKKFLSQGAGNRICKACARINAQFGIIPEPVLAMQRGAKRRNGERIDVVENQLLRP